VRPAEPHHYWFDAFNGPPEFVWDDWEVSEDEYRRHAPAQDVAFLDDVLAKEDR
jgi:hypothetical protein